MLNELPDECLQCIGLALRAPRDILRLAAACCACHAALGSSLLLYRMLCEELLGLPLVEIHRSAWSAAADDPRFYRRLFRAASTCDDFVYANRLRNSISHGFEDGLDGIAATGHTATSVGQLVAIVGGWRPDSEETCIQLHIIDIQRQKLITPTLAEGSARPHRRLRHASCSIQRPGWLPLPAGQPRLPCVLVLGGASDGGPYEEEDEPALRRGSPLVFGGLRRLLVLDVCAEDGSVVRWHELDACGDAPKAMWHHTSVSFARGTKVVVFGGDMVQSDPEYARISTREEAAIVYVLDVESRRWERVATGGSVPCWRSLHTSTAFRACPATGREAMVVLGGSTDRVLPFSSGNPADFEPRVLCLESFTWHGPADLRQREASDFLPAPRMRFAAGVYGHHLIVYSGHGDAPIPDRERHLRLDLRTLVWARVQPRNAPVSLVDTPASVMCAGVIAGGVEMSVVWGIRPVPKLDLLVLAEPQEEGAHAGLIRQAGQGARATTNTPSAPGSETTAKEDGAGQAQPTRWEGAPRLPSAGASSSSTMAAVARWHSSNDCSDSDSEKEDTTGMSRIATVEVADPCGHRRTLRLPFSLLAELVLKHQAEISVSQGGDGEDAEAAGEEEAHSEAAFGREESGQKAESAELVCGAEEEDVEK